MIEEEQKRQEEESCKNNRIVIEEEKKRQEEKGRARPRPVIIDGALEMAKSDGGKFAEFAERAASASADGI